MSPKWQKLQPENGLGLTMTVSTHSLSQESMVTNYDVDLSEGISSLVIEAYDANSSKLLLRTKIYRINRIENV